MPINVNGYEIDSFEARQHQYDGIVRDGLVLQLDAGIFNTVTGTTWYDLSGNSNSGTLTNGPTFNSANGGSIVFDGSNDTVVVSDNPSLNVDSFTVMFSVLPKSSSIKEMIVKHSSATGGIGSFEFYQNYLAITIRHNGTTLGTTPNVFTLNEWHIVFVVYDKVTIKLYVNNVQMFSQNRTVSTVAYTSPLAIGGYYNGSYSLNGNMGFVNIYNRALSSTEITQNYNALKGRYGL